MIVLIVDGYNVIGAAPSLKLLRDEDLGQARELLVNQLAEYQAYTGYKVIVVFDAYSVHGIEKKEKNSRVEVIYTKENETADERIEKLVKEIKNIQTQVYVATSDYTEQRTIFAQGALRKSARELLNEIKSIERSINNEVKNNSLIKNRSKIPLNKDVLDLFEKWRRGEK
ncbi:NYN domain-containing protein [Salirhabdus salicampi]|uniref:NYN domain-containing protein n=1 Tax=Salirhabdus salicampi TaxID=476102 RepID=UPI0020C2DFDD|nr:NYN domain-containing protein [Salirhabdus salicampi]MCP8618064.1 NYN domain-containing protein [Salirhabdus salicampi]